MMVRQNIKMPRTAVHKVFRPIGRVRDRKLLCLCGGCFFQIEFRKGTPLPYSGHVENPHFRLVLKTNFRLVGTMYGVPEDEYRFDDIYMPHQVIVEKPVHEMSYGEKWAMKMRKNDLASAVEAQREQEEKQEQKRAYCVRNAHKSEGYGYGA